ncbi:hypothetical protein QBC46DRAFT_316660 [Diplogelasinospora grovesii]|uniref:Chitin deacetylase n=1 Tax=Diplogelasinospora grovesii TaxID=303347 RepID=A0AAN6N607_9PEZI|nr:hypothetical protein QBC46DRAFT_316660 [Diplogelasinospora grovesii]
MYPTLAAGLLAVLPLAQSFYIAPFEDALFAADKHESHSHDVSRSLTSASSDVGLESRAVQSGGDCGPSAGNAVCASGLCCSSDGVCGTGTPFCGAPDCQLSFGPACDGNQTPPGKDTSAVPRPLFGSVPYGVDISHCTVKGKVALTFDDGPYIYTTDLLNVLKSNNVKATFFVVGANGGKGQIQDPATGYPAIIKRMYAEGHQIGSHTWSHQDLSAVTAQQRHDQIVKNEMALVDILGFFPTYLRPPYTKWNDDALNDLKALGYHVTNYDIDTRDWQGDYTYAQNVYTNILSQHSPASSSWISIEHDIKDKTVHGFVQYMIDQARQLGYQLVTVGECLGDPQANWYRDPTTGQPYDPSRMAAAAAAATTVAGTAPPPPPPPSSSSSSSPSSIVSVITSSPSSPGTSSPAQATKALNPGSSTTTQASSGSGSGPSSKTSSSAQGSSSSPSPTPVANPNFGAGTGNTTTTSSVSVASAITTSATATQTKAQSGAVRSGDSAFGVLLAIFVLLVVF